MAGAFRQGSLVGYVSLSESAMNVSLERNLSILRSFAPYYVKANIINDEESTYQLGNADDP